MRKLLPVMIALSLIACNKNEDNPNTLNDQDKAFLTQVYASNRNEIEAGQIALNTSSKETVRSFASDAVNFYTAAQKDLRELISKISFNPDTTRIPVQGSLFADLGGYTFDTAYMKSRVLTHRNLLAVYQNQMNEGNHPYVRYYYFNKYFEGIRTNYLKADSIARDL